MSMNKNNPSNPLEGSPEIYGNVGIMGTGMPGRPAYGQWQSQFGSGFQYQYSLSQAQADARAQAQAQAQAQVQAQARAHAIAQAQAARAQYQAHFQSQVGCLSMRQNPALGGFGGTSFNVLPGGSDDRRFFQKPPLGPEGTSLHRTPSPMNTMELTPTACRMKQQSPERQPRKRVAALLPESALFTQLLEFENRLDAELINKKHDIQEAMRNPPCVQKILRVYIFNTFANQTPPTTGDADPEPLTWTLKVIGRILEEDPNQPEALEKSNASYPKFSSFFKKVTITLDEQLYPDDHTVVWEQARSIGNHDGFEVKRKGDKEFNARISLELNYTPKKFRLSTDLAALLGFEIDTRARIIAAIWHYVKARNLQDRNDTSVFFCDPPLQKVFGLPKMTFTMVSQRISPHLSPPSPINLEHWVKLSGSNPVGNACYDVLVDLPFPVQKDLANHFNKTEKSDEIKACDVAISDSLLKIHEHYKRRAFFLGFSQSPAEFINAIIESQSRDSKLVAGESSSSAAKGHVSEFYNQPWAEDAVIRYLNRKQVAEKDGRRRA